MLISAQRIPILGFLGVPEKNASSQNYKVMKDAGFSISLMTFSDHQNTIKALNAAQKVNIKLILSYPELFSEPQKVVPEIKKHPALLGYFLGDEPSSKEFLSFKALSEKIEKFDNSHLFYINLFPNYASPESLNMISYEDYIIQAVQKMPLSFISFDHYPLIDNKIRLEFYENLEIVREVSLQRNKPFWGFACTTIHFDYLKPEIAGLKLQQFGNLLYGAQGLQYFTYWTMTSDSNWKKNNFSYSIVDENGNPTPTYKIVKTVNEQIQRLSWVFLGAKCDEVYHTGNEIPRGTKRLAVMPRGFKYFSTNESNALVSFMTNKKHKFILIQNKSLDDNLILNYQLAKPLKLVNNTSGKTESIISTKKQKTTILPGDILIFTYQN